MSQENPNSRGASLAERLWRGRSQAASALLPGARELPLLHGVTIQGHFTEPAENVLARARQLLNDSGNVYQFGNSIVITVGEGATARLITVCTEQSPEKFAPAVLANIFLCEIRGIKDDTLPLQFPPPSTFVSQLLNGFPIGDSLPRIKTLFQRPVFDENFSLCSPGWYPSSGIYVQGVDVAPIVPPLPQSGGTVLERCPPGLRTLLCEFCFRADADSANYLAMLLTGVLANHFVESGKPLVLFDGNQPGLGKTLLARTAGVLLDGDDPALVDYMQNNEELSKRLCAYLRGGQTSVIIFDNAKNAAGTAIDSPVIESQSMAPLVSMRILGQSANYQTANVMLWMITMNDTKASPDMVSRGLPVRLQYEGQPEQRRFTFEDPIAYVRQHRSELLGELLGMVERWTQAGRPSGQQQHRCHHWARIVGGILDANGITEFLTNRDEAAAEFNVVLDELSALAEAVIKGGGPFIERQELGKNHASEDAHFEHAQTASEWLRYFLQSHIDQDRLEKSASQSARSTLCGKFLSRNLGRRVPIEAGEKIGTAELRMDQGRSRSKKYYFIVRWESESALANGVAGPSTAPSFGVRLSDVQPDSPGVGLQLANVTSVGGNQERW